MVKFFKKYLPFSKGVIEVSLSYRWSIILWSIANYLTIIVTFFIWEAIYKESPSTTINGFTFQHMIFYLFATRIVSQLTSGDVIDYVTSDVKSGAISMHLIKPISYRTYIFFNNLGEKIVNIIFFLTPYTVILIIVGYNIGITYEYNLINILLFVLSIILSLFINFFISIIFAIMVFYTVNNYGIYQAYRVVYLIFSGMLIPLSFFPLWLYRITEFLPFMHTLYVPTMIFMNQFTINESIQAIGFQLLWVVILGIFVEILWRVSIKKLVILGG